MLNRKSRFEMSGSYELNKIEKYEALDATNKAMTDPDEAKSGPFSCHLKGLTPREQAMLHREDDHVQAVLQVVPSMGNHRNITTASLKKECLEGRKKTSVHWADPLVDDTLSEKEIWKMIMAVADVGKRSLREQWMEMRKQHVKRGNLQIYKKESVPVYLAEVDRMRNFRSLTAGAAVRNRQGKWNNLDVVMDTGAAVTLLSEKTFKSMDLPGKIFEGVDVPLLDASGNSMKVRGLV